MPSTSKAQQRLMGMAYSYKKGELSPNEVTPDIKKLADSMTMKQLKDFASTKHNDLRSRADENIALGNLGGMGANFLPNGTEVGSGDILSGTGDAEEEYKKKKKKKQRIMKTKTFEEFVNEMYDGSMSDFKYEYPIRFEEETGNSPKAIKKMSKKGKGYEVRTSSYMSREELEKVGLAMGLTLKDYKKSNIVIAIYE